MPLPNFLAKLFGGSGTDLVSQGFKLIDNLTLSNEEKENFKSEFIKMTNDHIEKMGTLAETEYEASIKDMADARAREIQISTSDKAPLLNKIITPILGLFVVVSTIVIWALILFRHYEPKTNEAMIIGALTTLCGGVLNYYFGSSIGSKTKTEQFDKMLNK